MITQLWYLQLELSTITGRSQVNRPDSCSCWKNRILQHCYYLLTLAKRIVRILMRWSVTTAVYSPLLGSSTAVSHKQYFALWCVLFKSQMSAGTSRLTVCLRCERLLEIGGMAMFWSCKASSCCSITYDKLSVCMKLQWITGKAGI